MRLIKYIVILAVFFGLVSAFFIWQRANSANIQYSDQFDHIEEEIKTSYTKKIEITEGSTFGKLMYQAEISPAVSQAIFNASKNVYDLTNIRLGRTLDLVYDIKTEEFQQLIYQIDSEEKLYVFLQKATSSESTWLAERKPIPYEIKIKTAEGTIETSMWESGLDQGIDERAIISFANIFQWSIDFAWQVRSGDSYKFIYEERYLDGEYIMPGRILAGKFRNQGKDFYAFYYRESEEKLGYFDQEGNSVQKVFLKAPLEFKYISSGFTTGQRYISAFNIYTGHRAIDYAAPAGTPIRSVGDGTIVFAGWDGSYGRKVSVRHNSTYTTNYAHMSKIAVKYGQKVSQGQVIGYVGSTGLSTGPHLHYEMVKNGIKINPLAEEFSSTEGISEENKQAYFDLIKDWKTQLD